MTVGAGAAVHAVVPAAAVLEVGSRAPAEPVRAGPARDAVVARAALSLVGRLARVDAVVAALAVDLVGRVARRDRVVAVAGVDDVALAGADDLVGAGGALDVLEVGMPGGRAARHPNKRPHDDNCDGCDSVAHDSSLLEIGASRNLRERS